MKPSTLYEKKYTGEYLIPGAVSEELLKKLDLDEKLSIHRLDKCNLKIDYIQEEQIITDSSWVKLDDFIIKDISGEDVNISEGDFYALINDSEKEIYIGSQVNYFYLMLEEIKIINQNVLSEADAKIIKEADVKSISKQMLCFKDAFELIHPEIPIESIARYRLINHMMILKPSKTDIKKWLALIKKHEIVDFSVVKSKSPIGKKDGFLYVPKDRSRTQSTLKHINDRYFNNTTKRSLVDIYDQTIKKIGDNYYTGGKKIENVVLLFDTIQNGKSTKDTIDKYINDKGNTMSDKIITFECDGKVIALSEILHSNSCKIKIFSIYAADNGIKNVKDHITKKYPTMAIEVLEPIKKLTSVVNKTDMELIERLYHKRLAGGIRENCYLVVREYNQPKLNIMSDDLLEIERVVALFCKRTEL